MNSDYYSIYNLKYATLGDQISFMHGYLADPEMEDYFMNSLN